MPDCAYGAAIKIGMDSSQRQLASAAQILAESGGVVLLQGALALRPSPRLLACEVIDPTPGEHRCAEEFKVLIENASRMLAASPLGPLLPPKPHRWSVVDGSGTDVLELWPTSSEIFP